MFRSMLFLGLVLALVIPACPSAGEALSRVPSHYGWTLSASSTDPFDNVGPASSDTLTLYVWLYCALPETGGVSTSHFGITGLDVLEFEPSPGVVNAGLFPGDLDLSLPGCPRGSFLAGTLTLYGFGVPGAYVCFYPPDGGPDGLFETYGCGLSEPDGIAYMGYARGVSGPPCTNYLDFFLVGCDPTTSVASESWGRLKALYR